jgi:NADPH:quinone reductase-like Zn-dependent oxidoreductase
LRACPSANTKRIAGMALPKTMIAVHMTKLGGPEVLEYKDDVPVPTPSPGEVLIRVGAAGVNNTDINTRIGWYSKQATGATADTDVTQDNERTWGREGMSFPRIQGADVAGVVVAVGASVDPSRLGERVVVDPCPRPADGDMANLPYFGSECNGGFAQFCVAPASSVHKMTVDLTDAELATFPCSYSTSENLLTRSRCTATDIVLVTGASGGVGSATIQLAKRRGATVIALCGAAKASRVKALGADRVLDRNADIVTELGLESVTVVVDLVGVLGGPSWPRLLDVLRRGGRYATSGAIAGPMVELDLRTLYLKDLTLLGCTGLDEGVFASLVGYINRGEVKPLVAATYPLKDISQAQEDFLLKKHVGKLVLVPPAVDAE